VAPLDPTVQNTHRFTSTQATVTVGLPAGFFTATLTATDILFLSYTPVVTPTAPTHTPPGGLHFGNFQFDLALFHNDVPQHGVTFAQPITLTIVYNPALMMGLNQETLDLYHWDGAMWHSDDITLLDRNTANHTITWLLAHLSEFAFFAAAAPTTLNPDPEPLLTRSLFLPAVMSGVGNTTNDAPPEPTEDDQPEYDAAAASDTSPNQVHLPLIER